MENLLFPDARPHLHLQNIPRSTRSCLLWSILTVCLTAAQTAPGSQIDTRNTLTTKAVGTFGTYSPPRDSIFSWDLARSLKPAAKVVSPALNADEAALEEVLREPQTAATDFWNPDREWADAFNSSEANNPETFSQVLQEIHLAYPRMRSGGLDESTTPDVALALAGISVSGVLLLHLGTTRRNAVSFHFSDCGSSGAIMTGLRIRQDGFTHRPLNRRRGRQPLLTSLLQRSGWRKNSPRTREALSANG